MGGRGEMAKGKRFVGRAHLVWRMQKVVTTLTVFGRFQTWGAVRTIFWTRRGARLATE